MSEAMRRFMIGQYGSFDDRKYARDFVNGFFGMEACLFPNENHIAALVKASKEKAFRIGVHFPLRAGCSPLRDAPFLAADRSDRLQVFQLIQQELDDLAEIDPSYVLFHYPKPVILDDRVDWSH